jgi:membrane-bound lytic murein transglycosylase D
MAHDVRRGLGGWLRGGWVRKAVLLAILLTPRVGVPDDSTFPTPGGLEPAVRFWLETFTRYGWSDVVIHDRAEPGVVYDVVHGVAGDDRSPRVRRRVQAVIEWLDLTTKRASVRSIFLPPSAAIDPALRVRTHRGARETFARGLASERLFRAKVRRALAAQGLPLDLAALPLVESSYHPGRVSSAGAVGLWQLTAEVADRYIRVDGKVDERRDPARASLAAAAYLRDLHDQLGSWPLALTAYNHGPNGMLRAVKATGSNDLGDIVRRYESPTFGFASKSFYAAFLAARHALEHQARYFPELAPGKLVTYTVRRGDTLDAVARRHGVTVPSLRVENGIRSAMIRPGQMLLVRL